VEAPRDNYEAALAAARLGYRCVPCRPGTKVPAVAWKRWQTEMPPPELLRRWFSGTRHNLAVLTDGLVVFDCDDPAEADRVLAACGDTPYRLRTPCGGVHLAYRKRQGVAVRNAVKVRGWGIDLRTDGGLALLPPSTTDKGAYAWLGPGLVPKHALPVATVGWTRERTRRRAKGTLNDGRPLAATRGPVRFPEAYCLRVPSVQGQNGSRGLVRVVCVLRDAGRTRAEILAFVRDVWGPACCVPEWSEPEIRHCIDRHYP
jgi:hypothetical protein